MKTATLPICIPAIPSPDASPEIWRQVAPILQAIAEREKRNEDLYPSERTAYNAIAFAQHQATKRQWLNLWQYLLDRKILHVGEFNPIDDHEDLALQSTHSGRFATGSENSLSKLKESDINEIRRLRLLCGYTLREIAAIYGVNHQTINQIFIGKTWSHIPNPYPTGTIAAPPPKPKTQRPTKPPKNKIKPETNKPQKTLKPSTSKVLKPEAKRKRVRNRERLSDRKSPTFLYEFVSLAPCLSGLLSILNLYKFFAYSAPLCPRVKIPIADRPDGQRIKALLAYKTSSGEYASLKVYLPSLKRRYRMNSDVLRLLLDWSNPLRTRTRKKVESDKKKGVAKRIISTEQINQVLTDKWQDAVTITVKLNELLGENIDLRRLSKLLYNRSVAGEIHRYNRDHHEISFFSRIEATEFENEWMTLEMAYQLAVSRGCPFARNTFRKTHRFDYSAYGLEFRKAAPATECSLLRYRDIQS
jgi:hypothetical protein